MVLGITPNTKFVYSLRSLGDLNGFVEHLEEYKISGKIYAANVMDAGLVKNQSVFQKAYDMGYAI